MDFVVPSGAAPAVTSRSLLVGWANDQDAWLRQIVSDVIVSRNALTDDQLQSVYQLFLREKALAAGQAISVPLLADGDFSVDTGIAMCLLRLCDLKNVNALAEGQTIEFNLRLTIIFGENACGKTGYVRVLKKAAAVRTAEPVLPDVSIAHATIQSPSARITFQLGKDEPKETEWNDQAGLAPFNRIDVFDSRATALHVDGDLNYVYTPGELFRFPLVQQAIEGVRARLDQALRDAAQPSSPFLAHFERASRIYPLIDSLGAATDIAELRKLAHVTDEEEQTVATLRAEVEALRTTSPTAQLKLAETSKQNLDVLSRIVSSIGRFDTGSYASALTRLQEAQRKYDQATRNSFGGLAIPGMLQEEWRQFIQAGEAYLQTLDQATYPAEDQECLYCRQPLSSEAIRLLTKYREYCNNTLRVELDAAQQAVESIRRTFTQNLDLGDAGRRLDESSDSGGTFNAGETSALKALLARGTAITEALASRRPVAWPDQDAATGNALHMLRDRLEHTKALLNDLTERRDKKEDALRERRSQLLDVESRIKLRGLLPQIEKAVEQAKWADKAKIQQRKFPAVLRSLTETSKAASEQLLNRDFERRFTEECQRLRAPKVSLLFPGRQGQVTRKKAVARGEYRPSDVLSEGEQKVIALADFLAESSLKPAAPVIFDDPINSLDYKRMAEVVDRIVLLSESCQVIVFTHNIWFATELLAKFEKQAQHCSYYNVSRDGTRVGIVSKGTHPRSDTFSNLKGRINSLIQTAQGSAGEAQAALIEKAYELIRNICDVIVEKEFLQGVTQRYQPNVMMTRLPEINFSGLQNAVTTIYPIYEDCCRYIGSHSQPMETLNVRPTLESLKKDWQTVQTARETYLKKK